MNEILPGLFHWTTHHEGIGREVSSLYVAGASATLIDPMLPPGGVAAIEELGRPQAIVLSNRHHLRHSERLVEAFGCPILCHEAGLHEFEDGGPIVHGFRFGDELRPGIEALEMDAICDEDTALHLAVGPGALSFADALIHYGNEITFVPDFLIGDDPEGVKRGVRASVRRLLDVEFDALLFAHGDPILRDGKEALRRFVDPGHGERA